MKNTTVLIVLLFTAVICYNFIPPPNNAEVVSDKVGINIGDIAPEIILKSPNGKSYKLSSLRGKYVLIDFWASWCGPCRKENPNLVNAYSKYNKAKFKKGKGFEIFSVSLDHNKASWKKAIKADNLSWKYHGSDFKGWKSKAVGKYKVKSIPYSLLIDPNGKIISKKLKGMKLHLTLDKFIKSF